MDFGLSEEQQQLRDSARELLAGECPTTAVRKAMASDEGTLLELYAQIAKLGWTGLIVPEQFGGAGLRMLDMAVVLEEQGYAAMPGPFLFSSGIAADAIAHGNSTEQAAKWLRGIADGSAIGTIAIVEAGDSLAPADFSTTATRDAAKVRVSGTKMFVPYASLADIAIVAARNQSAVGLYLVELKSSAVRTKTLKSMDLTRRVASVEFDSAPAIEIGGAELYSRLLDVGAIAVAADSLGGAQRALDMAVDYSKVR